MHPFSIFLIALAMSSDAFAAAVGKGAAMRNPGFADALRAGLIFGAIEAITPVIGWLLGQVASTYISAWDHWIAFALLSIMGARMIHAGLGRDDDLALSGQPDSRTGFWALAATGFATSLDAMAVGVGLAFIEVSIVTVSLAIGATTLVMVTAGILLGRVLGRITGKRAEIIGGAILICVGAGIVYQHLSAV